MRKIFIGFCISAMIFSAKAIAKPFDVAQIIGMSTGAATEKYGAPARIEPSEYGFEWYVYSKDYNRFFMVGVLDGRVVAIYSNAKTLTYAGQFSIGTKRDAVRSAFGEPVTYLQSNGSAYVINNPDQHDYFVQGDNFVIVFYDNLKKNTVTAMLIVPCDLETTAQTERPVMTDALIAANERINADLVNSIRVRNGKSALKPIALLGKLADIRSIDMRDKNYLSHFAPDGTSAYDVARKIGVKFAVLGENISGGLDNAIFSHEAFMNSKSHRENVLNASYHRFGSGIAYGGSMYSVLTEIFVN